MPLLAPPRNAEDLLIAGSNVHVLAFDNISSIPSWLSDALCRLSTGGGLSTRTLYTNRGETRFDVQRPVILNGIEEFVTRQDLADRALVLTLSPIPEHDRRLESEIWADLKAAHPRILGAMLDAVVLGLRRLPTVNRDRLPRMADFAVWGMACEPAFGPEGAFEAAYSGNRQGTIEAAIEDDVVSATVCSMMSGTEQWLGTATDLLKELTPLVHDRIVHSKDWPTSGRGLSGRLRRASSSLRKIGVDVEFGQRAGRAGNRLIQIAATADLSRFQPSAPSVRQPTASEAVGATSVADDSASYLDRVDMAPVSGSPGQPGSADAADGADDDSGAAGRVAAPTAQQSTWRRTL
jgi:hypothetical protein